MRKKKDVHQKVDEGVDQARDQPVENAELDRADLADDRVERAERDDRRERRKLPKQTGTGRVTLHSAPSRGQADL